MNLYQEQIYKSHLEHSMPRNPRKNHKYLYIDQNGRYIYAEDLKKGHEAVNDKLNSLADRQRKAAANLKPKLREAHENFDDKLIGLADTAKEKLKNVDRDKVKEIGKSLLGYKTKKMLDYTKEASEIVKEEKKKSKKKSGPDLPEGYETRADGHVYDALGAIASQAEIDRALAAQKKKKSKTTAKK